MLGPVMIWNSLTSEDKEGVRRRKGEREVERTSLEGDVVCDEVDTVLDFETRVTRFGEEETAFACAKRQRTRKTRYARPTYPSP